MDALAATGFDGLFSLEIFNDQFRSGSTRQVAIDGHRSLINLLDRLHARSGQVVAGLTPMPARAKCLGVEFIEFAIDDQAAVAFEHMLLGLGFRRAGQHISKQVTRWCQGDINIVVNTEKEGFAHSYNITHGTAVCALGLRVDDAAAALDRAQLLLDMPFRQAVGPGELEIPAVRGLGGSLIYFIDPKTDLGRVWDIEFRAVADGSAKGDAGLQRVDHLQQVMLYDEMLSWLLFYTSLLEVEKTPAQDVARSRRAGEEPGGAVRRRPAAPGVERLAVRPHADLALPVGGLRLGRAAHRAVDRRPSGNGAPARGERHEAAAGARRTITTTSKPRASSTMELIDTLKAHNIFYDREGDAEYFQVYTATIEDRFFFEIVERRGYRGYGAVNAPIRLAAQARLAGSAI